MSAVLRSEQDLPISCRIYTALSNWANHIDRTSGLGFNDALKDQLIYTSCSASSHVACAEWPSCHKNSLVRRKGCGCLNSHLCIKGKGTKVTNSQ